MSKRYREVLDDVETPATRRATREAADRAAEVATTGPADPPAAPVPAPEGDGGGVATLVRPARTAASVIGVGPRPVTMRGARPADGTATRPVGRPANRPGNGPTDADEPLAFAWRGRHYEVTRILGHWREEEGWWRRPDGEPIRIEQSDLWRVEAVHGSGVAPAPIAGVYELARRGRVWRLDRVWD